MSAYDIASLSIALAACAAAAGAALLSVRLRRTNAELRELLFEARALVGLSAYAPDHIREQVRERQREYLARVGVEVTFGVIPQPSAAPTTH